MIVDTNKLPIIEKKPGWRGRYFHSADMTFGHYDFDAGAQIPCHSHVQEEVWHVLEGELEIAIKGERHIVRPGFAAVVPPDTPHAVLALTKGRAIVVDTPLREGFVP